MRIMLFVFAGCMLFSLPAVAGQGKPQPMRYLVAMDFGSDFDNGKLGRAVGRMFRYKSIKRHLFSVDTEIDWDERSELMKRPSLDADPAAVAVRAREEFGCKVIVWGEVEQVEKPGPKIVKQHKGFKTTRRSDKGLALRLHVRAIDLDRDPEHLAVNKTYACKINYEITARVDEVLKLLTGVQTPADIAAAHISNRMRAFGPNLCVNGKINVGVADDSAAPWRLLSAWYFPMKAGIGVASEHGNRFLRYELSKNVAATTGLFCYTPYIPIKPETYYQVSFRVRTFGPKVIMFVKGYRDMRVKGYEGVKTLRQETFKHQKRFYGDKGKWGRLVTRPFLPRSAKPQHMPQFIRVQLYAYWPRGRVDFDDVIVRACRVAEPESPQPEVRPDAVPGKKPEAGAQPLDTAKPERIVNDQ